MKRILALLCIFACLCCLCAPVLAANDTVTVHAYVPGDWNDVRLWAWDDADQNPADAGTWPGNLVMTKGNDGWYTVEIPTGFPNMLINGDNGGKKTGDIKGIDVSKDVWIVVNGDGTTQVHNSKPDVSAPAKPAQLTSLALVGEGIPGVGTWIVDDPSGDMIKLSSKVYTKEIAVTAGATIKFKIAGNDSWDSGYNYGGAEEGIVVTLGKSLTLASGGDSKDLTLTPAKNCTLKFTVTLKNDAASLLVEEVAGSDIIEPPAPVELSSLALVGDCIPGVGTWIVNDPAGDMVEAPENVYSKEVTVIAGTTMKFKIAGNDTWDSPYNFGGAEEGIVVALGTALELASGNESKDLTLTADQDCTLKFIVTLTDGVATLLVEEVGGSEVITPSEPDGSEPGASEPDASKPAETEPDETHPDDENEVKTPDNTLLFIIIGSVVAVAIAAVVVIILKKKR